MKRITYEPEQLSNIINSYREHLSFDFHSPQEFYEWRSEIVPFLAEQAQYGRELLFTPAFIACLTVGTDETRFMCRLALRNLIEAEFIERIREIESARLPPRKA